ncbi:hypothetical protein MUO93_12390 [Candidatus Bathyarchaeota archaeon]|nr:hypothetical protein [Candidatus Bathyarchaeota archaeon]
MSLRLRLNYMGKSEVVDDIDFTGLETRLRDRIQTMLNTYGPILSANARSLLRQRIIHPEKSTGRLGRSIRYRVTPSRLVVYAGAPYGGFVEEGTRYMSGKHMIEETVAGYRSEIQHEVNKIVEESIREAIR